MLPMFHSTPLGLSMYRIKFSKPSLCVLEMLYRLFLVLSTSAPFVSIFQLLLDKWHVNRRVNVVAVQPMYVFELLLSHI